jgi:hypothetical protein
MSTKMNRIALNHKPKSIALANVRKYFPKVERVEDSDTPLQVEVTKADSNSSAVRNKEGCAMAVACKRRMKADGVLVARSVAYIIKGTTATRYQVPMAVQKEIVSFDREAGFAPGTYQLIPENPANRFGEKRKYGPGKLSGKPVRFQHRTTGIRTALGSDVEIE